MTEHRERPAASPTRPRRPLAAVPPTVVRLDEAAGSASTLKPFTFLEAIAQAQRSLSVSELSALLNVPQPTAHRIVHMLESDGYLEREPGSRRYAPGTRLVRLGLGVVATAVRAAPRRAILETLSRDIGETCNFGVMVGHHLTYLDRVEAAWPFGLRFEPGSRVPLHCTAIGKLLLSFMPPQQRQRLLNVAPLHHYTEHTITDAVLLEARLEEIRRSGVSTDDQEFLAGVVCVAVPVRAPKGVVIAGVAVSAPLARMSMRRALQCVPRLRAAAEQIGDTLEEASGADVRRRRKRQD